MTRVQGPGPKRQNETALVRFWRELNAELERRDHCDATWSQVVRAWAQALGAGEAAAIIAHNPELLR